MRPDCRSAQPAVSLRHAEEGPPDGPEHQACVLREQCVGAGVHRDTGRRPDVQLDRLINDSPGDVAEPVLANAHAYQIGATRDELAVKYHGTAALLARAPNLLAISSNGAGYDTVDVPACTRWPALRW